MKPKMKALGTERLKLTYDNLLSRFAFKFNLRRYSKVVKHIERWDVEPGKVVVGQQQIIPAVSPSVARVEEIFHSRWSNGSNRSLQVGQFTDGDPRLSSSMAPHDLVSMINLALNSEKPVQAKLEDSGEPGGDFHACVERRRRARCVAGAVTRVCALDRARRGRLSHHICQPSFLSFIFLACRV
jgi:hypothetical protein